MTESTATARTALRVLALIAVPLLLVLALPMMRFHMHSLHLTTCLQLADDLRKGAPVRISGVEVGLVRSVVVKPEDHACPVMVDMELLTDYELRVPRDSKAYSASEGLLGPAYIAIDSGDANGSPIENWGKLPSKVVPRPRAEELVNYLGRILEQSRHNAIQQSDIAPSNGR